jgi:hypothetical protein
LALPGQRVPDVRAHGGCGVSAFGPIWVTILWNHFLWFPNPAPVFGRDIDCPKCATIHPADEACNIEPVDRVWIHRANKWRIDHLGEDLTSEDCCAAIGRPLNDKLIGAVFGEWQRLGWIREVAIVTAKSKRRHGGTLRKWRIQ